MSALIAADHPSIVASVAAGILPVPFPNVVPDAVFHIDFPDFGFHVTAPITDFHFAKKSGKVTAQANISKDVVIALTLSGRLNSAFHINEVWLELKKIEKKPCAEFIASTFYALFGLSSGVPLQIPGIGLNLKQRFDMSLKRISQRLQMRQNAYRLMVIECATGKRFELPSDFSGSEIESIIFTYRAIVDRSFAWPVNPKRLLKDAAPATSENLARLFPDDETACYESSVMPSSQTVLGKEISLGSYTVIIEDFFIQNPDDVRHELAADDGHPVEFLVGSRSGQAIFNLLDAPRLPDTPWDPDIQMLVHLESQLDARLVEQYNLLAASTLAGLTEEQKAAVTARPDLDFGSFLTGDKNGETG